MLLKDFRLSPDRPDGGSIVESFVLLEMLKKATPEVEIKFWRMKSGEEVDFVWLKNRVPCPVEVKTGDSSGRTPGGLIAFIKRYPGTARGFVLHGGSSADLKVGECTVHFRPWSLAARIPEEIG